ncbi:MAG: hypothetical protein RRB13_10905 [bacterium]|nr:hypothetical protein [bacterium]
MKQFKLIYFTGCPNAKPTKRLLAQAGAEMIEEILQDNLPQGHVYKEYSSPTVVLDEEVLFGAQSTGGNGGCSLALPDLERAQSWVALARS